MDYSQRLEVINALREKLLERGFDRGATDQVVLVAHEVLREVCPEPPAETRTVCDQPAFARR